MIKKSNKNSGKKKFQGFKILQIKNQKIYQKISRITLVTVKKTKKNKKKTCRRASHRRSLLRGEKKPYYFCPLLLVALMCTHYSFLDDQITRETDTTVSQK